jgi:hypothetical protein
MESLLAVPVEHCALPRQGIFDTRSVELITPIDFMGGRMSEQREKRSKAREPSSTTGPVPGPTHDQERSPQQHPTMPPGRSDLALKRFNNLHENEDEHNDNSLQEKAKERAKHPNEMKVGTPYEWEELEAYRKELDRLDREGPKLQNP